LQEQLDKEQAKRQDDEMTRMYDLLEAKLIKYRDISEETCMLVDEKTSFSFAKGVRLVQSRNMDAFWNDRKIILHHD